MDLNTEVTNALEVLRNGGIILYPTDTVWGLGCDATNDDAVAKLFSLKLRDETKPMICLVNGDKMLYNVFKEIPEVAWQIWDTADKPTTIVLDNPRNVSKNLIDSKNSLGIRIVKDPFCFKLLERLKRPIVATSANISGQQTPKNFKEISPEVIQKADYVVHESQGKQGGQVSAIIKLTHDSQVQIIRK